MSYWFSQTVYWAASALNSGQSSADAPQFWPLLLKMGTALALVVGLMLVLSAGYRFLRLGRNTGQGNIIIKETRALGARKSLCLVEVRGREILLGITPERIVLLSALEQNIGNSSFAKVMDQQKDIM